MYYRFIHCSSGFTVKMKTSQERFGPTTTTSAFPELRPGEGGMCRVIMAPTPLGLSDGWHHLLFRNTGGRDTLMNNSLFRFNFLSVSLPSSFPLSCTPSLSSLFLCFVSISLLCLFHRDTHAHKNTASKQQPAQANHLQSLSPLDAGETHSVILLSQ